MTAPAVVVEKVVKTFKAAGKAAGKPVAALDGVSAEIAAGQITGLVGPDGSGKTTLLRLIAGLLAPDSGRISVLGHDSVGDVDAFQAELGYMPQRFGLYDDLTVDENLRLYADLHSIPPEDRPARFAKLLEFTALGPFGSRLAGNLSGGMKQKLGLACALLAQPKLLLLDEPSAGVDPVSRRELWSIVRAMAGEGVAIVWSTAYLDEAERCDAILLMSHGQLLGSGAPASFTGKLEGRTFLLDVPPGKKREVQRRAAANPALIDSLIQGASVRIVLKENVPPPAAEDLAGIPGAKIRPVRPRFEDAFVSRLQAEHVAGPATMLAVKDHGGGGDAIKCENLTKDFGDFRAVDGVSFTVQPGEVFGLLGPNGAGKSTTFRMLCGLIPPTAGTARVAGVDLGTARAEARERIGYMAQRFSLYAGLSVLDNLDFFSGVYGLSGRRKRERIDRVLDTFDLRHSAGSVAGDLPLGFKQRLALGCALLHEPEILFLDEPTSGVDPLMRREFWSRIGALADHNVAILVTSHFMDEAEYCDRIGIIYRGQVIAAGTPDELKQRFVSPTLPEPTLEDAFVALIEEHDRANAA